MSIFSDIKFLLKKYLKNPVLVSVGAYLLWRFINEQKKKSNKESMMLERIKIIEDEKSYNIIFDEKIQKYILIYKDRVFSSNNVEDLKKIIR